jgi:hypothetical protein
VSHDGSTPLSSVKPAMAAPFSMDAVYHAPLHRFQWLSC